MKTLALCAAASVAALLTSGCDKYQDAATEGAGKPAQSPAEPPAASQKSSPVVVVPAAAALDAKELAAAPAEAESCSGEMQAGSECSGGCDKWDQAAGEVAKRPIPANAVWKEIPVDGMTCGGCERRVIANVGQIDGVLAVEADAELGQVRVAMAPGRDLRDAAVARINSLGYRAR